MKSDRLIRQRFEELEAQIDEVEKTRYKQTYEWVDDVLWHQWATSVLSILSRVMGKKSVHYNNFESQYKRDGKATGELFDYCKGIFRAARADFEGGYLFEVEDLVSAEVIDDFLEQAQYLQEKGYKDPACVIAGVALETGLKRLCARHSVSMASMNKMNAELAKAGVYNVGMQKQITAWADRRNSAAHGNWDDYDHADVADMIRGVKRFLAEYL